VETGKNTSQFHGGFLFLSANHLHVRKVWRQAW
jgi:hypothetical protein